MALTEELPGYAMVTAVARDIPLYEMPALGQELLGRTIDRVLPDSSTNPVPVAAFQSSI
jgi:FXSXX-COOH protein